jgi:hypothetical protein
MSPPIGYVPGPPKKGPRAGTIIILALIGTGVLGVLGFVGMILLYAMSHNPPHRSETASAELPPEPPPPLPTQGSPLVTMSDIVKRQPELEDIWLGGPRLHALLTLLSAILETLGEDGRSDAPTLFRDNAKALRLDGVASELERHLTTTGRLPEDFIAPLREHLARMRPSLRLGVWRPAANARDASWFDYSALAAWVVREDPAYLREHLAARGPAGISPWRSTTKPLHPWLAREDAALTRLALQVGRRGEQLTPEERARLDTLTR